MTRSRTIGRCLGRKKRSRGIKDKMQGGTGDVLGLLGELEPWSLMDHTLSTWHIRRAELRVCTPDSKLAQIVIAPALDSTSVYNSAGMVIPHSDFDGWYRD